METTSSPTPENEQQATITITAVGKDYRVIDTVRNDGGEAQLTYNFTDVPSLDAMLEWVKSPRSPRPSLSQVFEVVAAGGEEGLVLVASLDFEKSGG